jgi:hypothetical protein
VSSFPQTQKLALRGLADIIPFIRSRATEGQFVLTDKGALSELLQRTAGDALLNHASKVWGVELKTEEENKYGNFFLETWSNRKFGMQTFGWLYTLRSDILLYYFLDSGELFSVKFNDLWEWAFCRRGEGGQCGRVYQFPEKPQGKHQQLNETWGRCVPIEVIGREVGFRKYLFTRGQFQEVPNACPTPAPPVPPKATSKKNGQGYGDLFGEIF